MLLRSTLFVLTLLENSAPRNNIAMKKSKSMLSTFDRNQDEKITMDSL